MTAQGFGHPRRCYRRKPRGRADQVIDFCGWSMVGGRGIEPLTPSMSRKCSPQKLNRISRRSVRPSLFVHICSRISWAFHGRVAPGERGHRMAQMVMRMMAIRASDHVLGGTQHPCHVVHTHSELQQHRGAGVPQDVRGNIRPQSGELPCRPPRSPLLGVYRPTCVFDDVGRCGTAPATKMREETMGYRNGGTTLTLVDGARCSPVHNP